MAMMLTKLGGIRPSSDAGFIFSYDPGHNFQDVNLQLFDNPAGPPRKLRSDRWLYLQLFSAGTRHPRDCRHHHEVHGTEYHSSAQQPGARVRGVRWLVLVGSRPYVAESIL